MLTTGTLPGEVGAWSTSSRRLSTRRPSIGLHVAAHAHGAEGIKPAVRAGVRSIEHGSLMDDEAIALMAEHGTWLVADIYNGDYIKETASATAGPRRRQRKNEETTQTQRDGFRSRGAGVKIAYGTDTRRHPWPTLRDSCPHMVRHGMTPMQGSRRRRARGGVPRPRRRGRSLRPVATPTSSRRRRPAADDLRGLFVGPFVRMKGGDAVKDDPA